MPHSLAVRLDQCANCHSGISSVEDTHNIRMQDSLADYDGDGNIQEGIAMEIETMHQDLLQAIQDYAAHTAGTPIVYAQDTYPYWFTDTNANGEADQDELSYDNRYMSWTPALLRAVYNYQFVANDPGTFAHNNPYILQVLYDSLKAIGGQDAVAGMTRAG
jgi:hypothetical protein